MSCDDTSDLPEGLLRDTSNGNTHCQCDLDRAEERRLQHLLDHLTAPALPGSVKV